MGYIIKLFVERKDFYSKPRNSLDVKKFKDLYASKAITVASSVLINYYKRRIQSN